MNRLQVNRKELLEILQQMIRIESVNPSLAAGGSGESEMARYLGKYMSVMGLEVYFQKISPGRENVIGVLKGSGGGRTLMLNGHTDTVGLKGMDIQPLEPECREGRVYGRGSLDMKGGLAAIISAVNAVARSGARPKGDIIMAFVADEEYASQGTEALVKEYTADAAIICEPTDMEIGIAHKGFVWARIEVFGRAAHGSRPKEGIDAIVKAGKVLVEIERLGACELNRKCHPLLGSPSIHASLISGGSELSTYPGYCRIDLERRTIPGETPGTILEELKSIINRISMEDDQFKAACEIMFHRPPLEVSEHETIVRSLVRSYTAILNKAPGLTGFSGWMDSAILAEAGIPTAVIGPGGEGLHAAVEYVDFDTAAVTAEILAHTITDFCN